MDLTFSADPLAPLRDLYRQAYLSSFQPEARERLPAFQTAWREQLSRLAPIEATELERAMAEERRRVDEARVIAELILPSLLTPEAAPSAGPRARITPLPPPVHPQPHPSSPAGDASGATTPAVADLLDAMLRQDATRSKRSHHAA